jgi:hypothetical protein
LRLLVLLSLTWANSAAAQAITDGDTLNQGGVTYRLWGIDAPEAKQVCPDGWPAGSLAATRLQALTAGRSIICQEKDRTASAGSSPSAERQARIWAQSWYARGSLGRSPGSASIMSTSRKRPAGLTVASMRMTAYRLGSGGRNTALEVANSA